MCGTPHTSRVTCTSAFKPATTASPSICDSDRRARSSSVLLSCVAPREKRLAFPAAQVFADLALE
jgi:hypothetical protein